MPLKIKNISLPGKKTLNRFQAVPGSGGMPTYIAWMNSTKVGGNAPRDSRLLIIDEFVKTYHNTSDSWLKLAALGELYFVTDFWLRNLKFENNALTQAREGAVNDLFLAVVNALCEKFDCPVNVLPQRLDESFGRVLTEHGHKLDHEDAKITTTPTRIGIGTPVNTAEYLNYAEVQRFRLIFSQGLAYQNTWSAPPPYKLALAESGKVGWKYHPLITGNMFDPGFAGFALSMGREFYMAPHRGGFDKDNFFHSSYLSGNAVLCTGSLLIEKGVVKKVKNDSGHYQPHLMHLQNVVQALRMVGVDPASIEVIAVKYSWTDANGKIGMTEKRMRGNELLAQNWLAYGAQARDFANKKNIKERDHV